MKIKMRRLFILSFMILCIFSLSACKQKEQVNEDALKFKTEYESLNGKSNASGLEHRSISISEDNPFVYTTGEDIVKKIENKESFFLYVGDKQCPWCRSVIEKSIEVAKKRNIKTIYYINIWDDDHNEIFRDTYKLEDDTPTKTSEGTDSYYQLLEYFKEVLRDYTLTDSKGNKVDVGEKRIYAPNFFYVKNGEVVNMVAGTSDLQEDSRGELTEEILEDQEEQFNDFFKLSSYCDDDKC